jgi:hypothetical protein
MPLLRSSFVFALALAASVPSADAGQGRKQTAPETFTSPMQARTEAGAAAAVVNIQIDRYTPEVERKVVADSLRQGGYPKFLEALRKAPAVGYVAIADVKVPVRFAREQETPKGRSITVVTEAPLYFVGGGKANAKPREGFEVAVLQLTVDSNGLGTGTMAAAAKVKRDGADGVAIEDYATEPIKLTSVHRVIK